MNANHTGSRRGIALIWAVFLFIALVAMMGLAIDLGYAWYVSRQLQDAADASALAGALQVPYDQAAAENLAQQIANSNYVAGEPLVLASNADNDPAGDFVIGFYYTADRSFTPTLVDPNAVKVRARRTDDSPGGPVPLLFGPIFGVSDVGMSRWAIAINGVGKDLGVVCLDLDDPKALYARGNATLSVEGPGGSGRGIYVNSNDSNAAAQIQGDALVQASGVRVVGEPKLVGNMEPPPIYPADEPIEDPLAYLPEPDIPEVPDYSETVTCSTGKTLNLNPGYYAAGIYADGGVVNLSPGVYILGPNSKGDSLHIGGNASLFADEVMLFNWRGSIDMGGTGSIQLTPPTSGTYRGVSIFQARDNTSEAVITGTAVNIQGTIYIPNAHVKMGGTAGTSGVYGNSLVVGTLETFGNNEVRVVYNKDFFIPGQASFLAE